jgi:hypothetical protein
MRSGRLRKSITVIASAVAAGALATGAVAASKPSSGFYLHTNGKLKGRLSASASREQNSMTSLTSTSALQT